MTQQLRARTAVVLLALLILGAISQPAGAQRNKGGDQRGASDWPAYAGHDRQSNLAFPGGASRSLGLRRRVSAHGGVCAAVK